ncbi:MAG: FitA-like ribbon-helix-helix domain-containing protein [Gammaproteobacteria bacterium]
MPTLTLRDLPEDLHDWLKRQAEAHHRSVNKEVIALLESLRTRPERALTLEEKRARIEEISRRSAALLLLDKRFEDDILDYDEAGLPWVIAS